MGYMFLDGLAHASMLNGEEGCCWSVGGLNQEGRTLSLNPGELYANSHLSENCVTGISLFHHPDCFDLTAQSSTLESLREKIDFASNPTNLIAEREIRKLTVNVPMASHSLDSAWSCRRKHWLASKLTWKPERFDFIATQEDNQYTPSAAEFGSLLSLIHI